MDLDTEIDVETCHISDNGRHQRYPGLQKTFFFGEARKSEKKKIASIIVDMKQGGLLRN